MQQQILNIDNRQYNIEILKNNITSAEAVSLIIVSYQPNKQASELLKACLESIKKYTPEEHEIWVIDNASPKENIKWLKTFRGINVVFNHDKHVQDGSYDNAIALEIAKQLIDPETKYLMTLHMDTVFCTEGWLTEMLSKFDDKIRAVGVRKDNKKAEEDILHILGVIFDFQLIKKLNLSFLPQMPKYDVGDLISVKFKQAGYDIYSFPNTYNDSSLIKNITENIPYQNLEVDRVFDSHGKIFFMHLGRGVVKSNSTGIKRQKTTIGDWLRFINQYLLADSFLPIKLSADQVDFKNQDYNYSVRRYYIDEFFTRKLKHFSSNLKVIDIGGERSRKKGQFNIEKYQNNVKYINLDPKTQPDYLCPAGKIPVTDKSFDLVIISELLEHVGNPKEVLIEAFRILQSQGTLLICSPFIFHLHYDPDDYCRYTDQWFSKTLKTIGFKNIMIERQGNFYAVLASMMKLWARQRGKISKRFTRLLIKQLLKKDNKIFKDKALQGYTTGFGVEAKK